MNSDDLSRPWQAQTAKFRLPLDAELLFKEVRRNAQHFTATIFWRDVREVGTGLLLAPLWLYLGVKHSLPWTWYLTFPVLVWIAGYLLVDRARYHRRSPEPDEPLRQCVKNSLALVERQIWLLGNVFWWYLLPLALSTLAFLGQVAWLERSGGWWTALAVACAVVMEAVVFAVVYWLNQYAVVAELGPRRQELEALLTSLSEETPPMSE